MMWDRGGWTEWGLYILFSVIFILFYMFIRKNKKRSIISIIITSSTTTTTAVVKKDLHNKYIGASCKVWSYFDFAWTGREL